MPSDKLVAIVTGAGSGIGYETAKLLREMDMEVWDLSRRERCAEGVNHINCDISDENTVKTAVNLIYQKTGHIDLVINNAGFGISGSVEFTQAEESERLIRVNLLGADNVTRACLKYLREGGGGRIVFVSSAAAAFPIPFQAWYSASKAALTTYALALRNEVKPLGIEVAVMLPGDIKTGFTGSRQKQNRGDDIYSGRIEKGVAAMERDEINGMSAAYAAKQVVRAATRRNPPPLKCIGPKYGLLLFVSRFLPARFVNFILGRLY